MDDKEKKLYYILQELKRKMNAIECDFTGKDIKENDKKFKIYYTLWGYFLIQKSLLKFKTSIFSILTLGIYFKKNEFEIRLMTEILSGACDIVRKNLEKQKTKIIA